VRGKTGEANGNRMEIDCVVPWPNYRLWCYRGSWIRDDYEIEGLDGTKMTISRENVQGYCYVTEMKIK